MAKSIFDRNPLTEMFSSVEEAMRCANSMELNNMLRNSFKGITTDPILGKKNKSKESMSIAIIVGDDSNNLNNINTLENGGKMKKFKYTGRYADGGKKLKPLPADNKGLQALAKKNPKLVMDMGFDPNSVAGETKGKKKKGPKVPKNQDALSRVMSLVSKGSTKPTQSDLDYMTNIILEKVNVDEPTYEKVAEYFEDVLGLQVARDETIDYGSDPHGLKPKVPKNQDFIGYLKDAAEGVGETLYDVGEGVVEGVTDFYEGFTENPRTDGLTWVERAELHKTESLPRSAGRAVGGLFNIHPFTQAYRHYFGGEEGRADNAALLGKGVDYSLGMFDYREEPSEGPKKKSTGPTVRKKIGELDGGMAPNLGAYPDIVYLTRFEAGGKTMTPGYQDAESEEATTKSYITNPTLNAADVKAIGSGEYTFDDQIIYPTTLESPSEGYTVGFDGSSQGGFLVYRPGETTPISVPEDELLLASGEFVQEEGEYGPLGEPILGPRNDKGDITNYQTIGGAHYNVYQGRGDAGRLDDYQAYMDNFKEQEKDRSNYPYYVFKSAGLDIKDFQKGQYADRSKTSNRELRRLLQEHLAAGGSPETFSVRYTAETADIEDAKRRLREDITTIPVELEDSVPKGALEKVPELSMAGMRDFNLADVMSQQQFDKMNELEEKAASGEQLTRRQQRRLNNLQSLYSRGTKASGEERRGTQATAAERASAAGQAVANIASRQTQPEMTGTQSRIARRSERLDDRISRAQERADRRADTQALRDEVQSKRQQLRNIRRGMDGMFFNPSMPMAGDGMGMMPGPIMTRPTIPNGGEVSGAPAFNYAADGMMTGAPNMGRLTNTVRGGSTASSTSTLSTALADAVRKGELSPEQAQKMLMILGEK